MGDESKHDVIPTNTRSQINHSWLTTGGWFGRLSIVVSSAYLVDLRRKHGQSLVVAQFREGERLSKMGQRLN